MTLSPLHVVTANYANHEHAQAIVDLMNHYAEDVAGGGTPLSDFTQTHLVSSLASIQGAFSVLAYRNNSAIGLVNCFQGFSTFTCKPLINIHDVVVHASSRGQGVAQYMLQHVEAEARRRGCCKITLEVLDGNQAAVKAYANYGFNPYELDATMGKAMFWEKYL